MSGLVNGIATILTTIFIDPDIALLTDEVVAGQVSDGAYRRYLGFFFQRDTVGEFILQDKKGSFWLISNPTADEPATSNYRCRSATNSAGSPSGISPRQSIHATARDPRYIV